MYIIKAYDNEDTFYCHGEDYSDGSDYDLVHNAREATVFNRFKVHMIVSELNRSQPFMGVFTYEAEEK